METRPLRHSLTIAGNSLGYIFRWPLDHLVPTYKGIFGTNEIVLQVCVTINFIIAIGLLVAGYKIKGDKKRYRPITISIQANYTFISILNILTRLPKKFDFLSTVRSYLLLISSSVQLLMLTESSANDQDESHFHAVIHFGFILESLLLSGLWQSMDAFLDQGDGISCFAIWFLLFIWILIGFLIPGFPEFDKVDNPDQKKQTDLSLDDDKKEDDRNSLTITREILVGSIDTIVLLFLQYG